MYLLNLLHTCLGFGDSQLGTSSLGATTAGGLFGFSWPEPFKAPSPCPASVEEEALAEDSIIEAGFEVAASSRSRETLGHKLIYSLVFIFR